MEEEALKQNARQTAEVSRKHDKRIREPETQESGKREIQIVPQRKTSSKKLSSA
jgi:hypothetical protein